MIHLRFQWAYLPEKRLRRWRLLRPATLSNAEVGLRHLLSLILSLSTFHSNPTCSSSCPCMWSWLCNFILTISIFHYCLWVPSEDSHLSPKEQAQQHSCVSFSCLCSPLFLHDLFISGPCGEFLVAMQ